MYFFVLICLSRNQGKQKHIFLNTTNRRSLRIKETRSSSPSLHARRSAPSSPQSGRGLQELPPHGARKLTKRAEANMAKGTLHADPLTPPWSGHAARPCLTSRVQGNTSLGPHAQNKENENTLWTALRATTLFFDYSHSTSTSNKREEMPDHTQLKAYMVPLLGFHGEPQTASGKCGPDDGPRHLSLQGTRLPSHPGLYSSKYFTRLCLSLIREENGQHTTEDRSQINITIIYWHLKEKKFL